MPNDHLLGTVPDADGDLVEVWRNGDETVPLISLREDAPALTFAPGGLDAARELLDRAAMPGQAIVIPASDDPGRDAVIGSLDPDPYGEDIIGGMR